MQDYKYEIGGKIYFQKPLVLGQIRYLINLLRDIEIPKNIESVNLISILGNKLPQALGIILIPENESPKVLADIEFEISPEQSIEVIENFFDCNPTAFLLEKLGGSINKITEKLTLTGLKKSASTSQMEILPKETESYGDIPLQSVSPISNTEIEK